MTDDLVEQLRARNPAPAPLPPPPIEDVLARIAAGERPATSRWLRWAGPSLAIVVAAAVTAVAVVSLHGSRHAAAPTGQSKGHTATSAHTPPIVVRSIAREAMRGSLHTSVLTFGPAGMGVIAWTQYRTAGTVQPKNWLATTATEGVPGASNAGAFRCSRARCLTARPMAGPRASTPTGFCVST